MGFHISSYFDKNDRNVNNTQEFFESFLNAFAEEALNFYECWGLFPFTYSEKQVNSVVVPAIHKITRNIWLEQPFKIRKEQRFLDIATVHNSNIYLIELKHSWNSKNDSIAKKTNNEWKTAIDQIATLRRNSVKQFVNHKDFNIYKIALMVMPTYLTNDLHHSILEQSAQQYAQNIFMKYQEDQSKKYRANYVSTWKIDEYNNYTHEYARGKQIFPFISFIAKIDKIFD